MFGVYEIQETVGQGGMGVVYRAHDTALDRMVALKVLKEDLRGNKQVAARFQREAEAIAALSHPGIIHIFAVGAVGRIPFISMEFIEGHTLSQLMKRERRIPWKRALHIAEQVAEALACAHEAHIIHRDIKPGNVLLGPDDRAYVTDFGIAKVLTAETQLTVEGSRLGTPNYMSPERCMNQEITPSSDVYSLGVVLFQMITGRLPYEAASPVDLIRKIVSDPPARLSDYVKDVPQDVERLVAFLIEKKPRDRPGDAAEVARMCRRVIEGEPLFEESAVASSLREFRDSDPSTSTGTTGIGDAKHARAPWARIRRSWRRAPLGAKVWSLGAAAIVLAAALGQLAARGVNEGRALQIVRQWDESPAGWMSIASPAEFRAESPGVTVVRLSVPAMAAGRVVGVGANGFGIALNGGTADARLGAVVSLSANPMVTRIVRPPASSGIASASPFLLAGESGASTAFPRSEAVLVADSRRSPAGDIVTALIVVDGSLADPSYGRVLVDSGVLGAQGVVVDAFTAASISPVDAEIAFAVRDVSADDHAVFTMPVRDGRPAGVPELIGRSAGRVERLAYARDGGILAARQDPGGVAVARYSGNDRDAVVYPTDDLTAQIADLLAEGMIVVSGPADERVLDYVPMMTLEPVRLGPGTNGAIGRRGSDVFVTAPDYRGNLQVFRVEPDAPGERTQLTYLARGVASELAVSRDGQFVLAALPGSGTPSVVLVDVAEAASATP